VRFRGELGLYVAASVVYVALGLVETNLLLSWFEGAAFLLLSVWIVPVLVRRLR